MRTKQSTILAMAPVVAVLILNVPAFAVTHTTTTNNSATSTGEWNGPGTATTSQAATVTTMLCGAAVGGGSCYKAVIDKPYTFSYADTLTLPQVGAVFNGAVFDQTFRDTTTTHENWHRAYADALLSVTYGALETWSAAYESNKANSAAAALALGNSDLAAALTVAQNAFTADFSTDTTNPAFGHQNAVAVIQNIGGTNTWRSQNPDWGQAAVNYANAIRVTFTKGPGNCTLVPEPGSATLLAVGIICCAVALRRQPAQ